MMQFWNERYIATKDYIYGKAPNVFFKDQLGKIKPGKILLPGDGEGRNGVYAATQKWKVDAFDFSDEAQRKALNLAKEFKVKYDYKLLTCEEFKSEGPIYDAIGFIFLHLKPELRANFMNQLMDSLKPGGYFILEVFNKNQIRNNTGGPKNAQMLYTLDELKSLLPEDMEYIKQEERPVKLSEGKYHIGQADVVRILARK